MNRPSFAELTETAGTPLSSEGAEMIYTRYVYGAHLARGRRVLELGCGSGPGLGLLASEAAAVVGCDIDPSLLAQARRHWGQRFPLVRASAERIPLASASFDLVLFFEASYYVPDMEAAFDEIARVLDDRGVAVFVNANPERRDFISSPFSTHYHTAEEFRTALERRGFDVTVEGAFPLGDVGPRERLMSWARRTLEATRLTPRTLKGRALLKRIALGKLVSLPGEIPVGFAKTAGRTRVAAGALTGFKVQYVTGMKRS